MQSTNFIQRMVSIFSVFVYMNIDLLKLKACKLLENGDADLSWLLFLKKPTCPIQFNWLIEWCFKPLSTVFQSYHGESNTNRIILRQYIKNAYSKLKNVDISFVNRSFLFS